MKADLKLLVLFLFIFLFSPAFSSVPNCEVLRKISYRTVVSEKIIQTDTIILQINNQFGEDHTIVSIPYSGMTKISKIKAWIEDLSGNVVRSLAKSEMSNTSLPDISSLYTDARVISFQLKHNVYPYKICYTYQTTETQFTMIADWSPFHHQKIPTREAKLVVTLPKDYPVKKFLRKATCYDSTRSDTEVTWKFSSAYDVINPDEIYAEPFENVIPVVFIAPSHFMYGIEGSNESWRAFGNWVYSLNTGLLDLPESEIKTVHSLVNGTTDKKEIIRILYYYLQDHTRYINVSIGIGGMKSFPASYVSKNKYGDCKALSTYMKAILKSAGIESFYLLVNASENPVKLIVELPCSQFNHVILCVPLGKDTVWLDNTARGVPAGYISSFIQNRQALFVDDNNSRLVKIPGLSRRDVMKAETITINKKGSEIWADTKISLGGRDFEKFNSLRLFLGQTYQDREVRKNVVFPNFELRTWKFNSFPRDSARIDLVATLRSASFFKPLDKEYYFNIFSLEIGSVIPPSERKMAIQLAYPVCSIDTIIVEIPEGLQLKSLPAAVSQDTRYGTYKFGFRLRGNSIEILRHFELFPGWYPSTDYPEFYTFIKSFRAAENKSIILKKTTESH